MDIQYLLFLQNLRAATGGVFNEVFNGISKFAVDILIFLPFFIFWCVDKKWGYRYLLTMSLGEVINGILKLTVCAYRPWIRSDQIEPAGDSKVAATGYSFPSGHTMMSTAIYGTTVAWQWNKRRWLAIICCVMIALTMFSRNFLGVHTPQDVVVGFVETLLIVLLVGYFQKKINGNDRTLDILSVVGILFVAGTLIYITQKQYPMDYVDGKLLVDPQKMMNDAFKGCGQLLGLIVGSFIERHYIHFEIPTGAKNLPILGFVGIMLAYGWQNFFGPATVVAAFGSHWGNMVSYFILWVLAVAVWPLVIRKFANDEGKAPAAVRA